MPNGRSGGFYLKRDELEQLLSKCEEDTTVGKTVKKQQLTVSKLRQFLLQWKGNEVLVEEQDHAWYIVQFSESEADIARWFVVSSDSPLFDGFRQHHVEWRREWAKKHQRP